MVLVSRMVAVSRIARTIHAWAGAALSLLVVLVATTGALLVWKDDFLRLTIPAARVAFDPAPEALARIAEAAEAAFGVEAIAGVAFATEDLGLSTVTLLDQSMAYLDVDGNVVDAWTVGGRPEDWLFDLHHRLLLGTAGLWTVGFAGLAVVALVIAGLLAWIPARRAFRLGPWLRGTGRAELLLSHRNIGVVAAPFVAIAALTGAGLAFPDTTYELAFTRLRHDDSYGAAFFEGLDEATGPEVAGWEPALARAAASFPGAVIRGAAWPAASQGYRVIRLQRPGAWSRTGDSLVSIDGRSGAMDQRIDAAALPLEERLFNTLYPVHTAGLGSALYKVSVFLTGAALAALGLLGFWAFLRRLRP
jgi:uncharacterized iron-regulated membrane protein